MIVQSLLYISVYSLKVILIALTAFAIKKTIPAQKKLLQSSATLALLSVLFLIFKFTLLQCFSYLLSFEALFFALQIQDVKIKTKKQEIVLYSLLFASATVIDFDIIFISINTAKLAYFGLTETLVVLLFIINILPKLLNIYGNLYQIDFIYKEATKRQESQGKQRNVSFYLGLALKILFDVFLTNRQVLLRNRQMDKLQKDVSEILTLLKDKNGITATEQSQITDKSKVE